MLSSLILSMNLLPGFEHLSNDLKSSKTGIFLIKGPKFSGKTTYCNNFLTTALNDNRFCIYYSSSYTEKQFIRIFSSKNQGIKKKTLLINPFVINHFQIDNHTNSNAIGDSLYKTLTEILNVVNTRSPPSLCLIMDSITELLTYYDKHDVLRFCIDLIFYLKEKEINSIFTIDNSEKDSYEVYERISNLFDGILETRIKNLDDQSISRYLKLVSLIGTNQVSSWIRFEIDEECNMKFYPNNSKNLICNICKGQIKGTPVYYSNLAFHKEHLNVYMKLVSFYGSSKISEIGSVGSLYANFFFIDIVGLSNPLFSVKKQIEKIQNLNNLILSCLSYKKDINKKVLPTGDGMAIAFISDPKLPVDLSIELHKKLNIFNSTLDSSSDKLKVRIGLGSGNVFLVNDLNDNQNMWGPGIVLARRVMDLGDDGHILVEGELAKSITVMYGDYNKILHDIGDYRIKHGNIIKVYSLFDQDYESKIGNPQLPSKFLNSVSR